MKKFLKIILIGSIALFSVGVLFIPSAFVNAADSVIQFEQTPLFNELNFMPGDSILHWIKVTNNSGVFVGVTISAAGFTSPIPADDLARALNIEIKQNSNTLYGPKTLAEFYAAGAISLGNVENGTTTQYDVTVSLPTDKGDEWQTRTTGFNINITVSGEGGTTVLGDLGDGGRSGDLISLYIFNEQNGEILATSSTLTWYTNLPATTRIIYDTVPHATIGSAPNYGYAFSTIEDPTLTTFHQVVITGLTPGITYYWRPISGLPQTLGKELNFQVMAVEGASTEEQGFTGGQEEGPGIGTDISIQGGTGGAAREEQGAEEEGIAGASQENKELNPTYFLASIGDFLKNLLGINCTQANNCCWKLAVILTILAALYLFFRERNRKKKEKLDSAKEKYYVDLIIGLAVIIVLIFLLKCWWLLVPLALFIGWIIKERLQ
ncbi:MAG: hypothetical protein NT012_03315 [Candidatus Nealsonbacteria bacterium]|nr:hypothetical protein [Candidatus Nealsonbacteria bacterium]